jgi:hypothetical protein
LLCITPLARNFTFALLLFFCVRSAHAAAVAATRFASVTTAMGCFALVPYDTHTHTHRQIHSTVGFAVALYMIVGVAGFAFTACRGEFTTADNILTE